MLASGRDAAGGAARPPPRGAGPPRGGAARRLHALRHRARRRAAALRALRASWIAAGRHAGMRYLEETPGVRRSPADAPAGRALGRLPRGALLRRRPSVAADGSRFARYAARSRLPRHPARAGARASAAARARRLPGDWSHRVCVDSTPLAERAFAAAAGPRLDRQERLPDRRGRRAPTCCSPRS